MDALPPQNDHALVARRLASRSAIDALVPLRLPSWDGRAPLLATEVRVAVVGDALVTRFRCAFDELNADPALPRDRCVPHLWTLDVVEVFVSDRPEGVPYRELEASPLGQWLSFAFDAPRRRSPALGEPHPEVTAAIGDGVFDVEIALPIAELRTARAGSPHAEARFRIAFCRVHGAGPSREHQSYPPVPGERPDFHRPERWATLAMEG